MGKNVVILTGSPRSKGNSNTMAEVFAAAVQRKGHTVTLFDTTKLNIDGCLACKRCYSSGKACIIEDDFNSIAVSILVADVIVFACPVYWYTLPAKLKAVIDKMYSFIVAGKKTAGKKYVLLTCCEESDPSVMDGVKNPLARTASLLKWTCLGEVLITSVFNIGDIAKTDGCKQAATIAEKI